MICSEITVDQIGRRGCSRLSDRSTNAFPSANAPHARSLHQMGNPLVPNPYPFFAQLFIQHTRGTIGASRSEVDPSDPVRRNGISSALRRGALQPRVIAAGTPYGALVETSIRRHITATGLSAWLAFTNSKALSGSSRSSVRTRLRLLTGSHVQVEDV